MINEKQVTGMKPLTLQQQFKGMIYVIILLIIHGGKVSWLTWFDQ